VNPLSEMEKTELLAQVANSPAAMAVIAELKEQYDTATAELVRGSKICDEDFQRDFRCLIGIAECARRILRKVNEAKSKVQNQ
jgi:hypothetical protein